MSGESQSRVSGVAVAVLTVVVGVAVWWFGFRDGGSGSAPAAPAGAAGAPQGPREVDIATVEQRRFVDAISAVGTVRADESAEITANVTETVKELHFEDGQEVATGDLLALLVSDEEEASLAAARATLDEQTREIERLEGLVRDGAAPQIRLQERLTLAEVARQRILEAEAKLADRRIHAPFDGVLGLRRISPGALVEPGTVITTLDRIDRIKLDFPVPEILLGSVAPGTEVLARSPAFGGEEFAGEVMMVDSRIDPVTRAAMVRAVFPNPERRLRPGMLMQVEVRSAPRESIAVPERAIVPEQQRTFVFRVRGGEEGAALGSPAVAEKVEVRIGRREPGLVEVTDGLDPGDRVVTDGVAGLKDGADIVIAGTYSGPTEAFDPSADVPTPAAAAD